LAEATGRSEVTAIAKVGHCSRQVKWLVGEHLTFIVQSPDPKCKRREIADAVADANFKD
jgi:hypothetical protein